MTNIGVPYHRSVLGPDGRYWWAQCPKCGAVVENRDGYGPGRHWTTVHQGEEEPTGHELHGGAAGSFASEGCAECRAIDEETRAMTYHQDWSVAHPVAINPKAARTPVYVSLDDAVERCADAFAPGSPSREWVRGWLATGQPLAGMRLIKARPTDGR